MIIRIDHTLCDGNGVCGLQAPDYFHLDPDYNLHIVRANVREDDLPRVRNAVQACPKAALDLVNP
jgi:ferredoxin